MSLVLLIQVCILKIVTIRVSGPRYIPPAFRQQMSNRQSLATIHSQHIVPSVQQTKLKVEPGTEQGVAVDVETETKPGINDPAIAHGESHTNSENSSDGHE